MRAPINGIIVAFLLSLCGLSATTLAHAQASADPHTLARTEYRQGQALANLLRWEDALTHMQRSYDTYPNASNTYALARILHALQQFPNSSRLFMEFLSTYPEADPELRASAQVYEEDIEARRRYIRMRGELSPTSNIRINGELATYEEATASLLVAYEADVHITVADPDGSRFEWSGTILGGDTARIEVTMESHGHNVVRRRRLLWGIIGGFVLAGAATAGIVLYADQAGLSAQSDRLIRLQP